MIIISDFYLKMEKFMSIPRIYKNVLFPGRIEQVQKCNPKNEKLLSELKNARNEVYKGVGLTAISSLGAVLSFSRSPNLALALAGVAAFGCDYTALFMQDITKITNLVHKSSKFINKSYKN